VEQFEQVMTFGNDDAMQRRNESVSAGRSIQRTDDFVTVLKTIKAFLTEPYKAAVKNKDT
jgi:hypothetical protein